ncbi:multiheme c-type cytochrome [Geoglobus sp.]
MRTAPRRFLMIYLSVILLFLVVRTIIVPPTFAEFTDDYTYRWFRGDAVREAMQLEMKFASKETCMQCHSGKVEFLNRGAHRTLSCETCHGPSMGHAKDPQNVKADIDPTRALCKLCHEYNPTRPEGFPQKFTDEHGYGRACIDCHNPHSPWVFRGGAEDEQ